MYFIKVCDLSALGLGGVGGVAGTGGLYPGQVPAGVFLAKFKDNSTPENRIAGWFVYI